MLRCRHAEREEILIYDYVVREVLLHQFHHLVIICFSQPLERRLLDHVAEVQVVLSVLWLPQLVDEQADRVRVRTDEAQTP